MTFKKTIEKLLGISFKEGKNSEQPSQDYFSLCRIGAENYARDNCLSKYARINSSI